MTRIDLGWIAVAVLLLMCGFSQAVASSGPPDWSVTVFGGPWTQRVVSEIVTDGNYDVSGALIGFALDRRIVRLGWGVSLAGEGVLTQNFDGPVFPSINAGLGLRFDSVAGHTPISVAGFTGPSYSFHPPVEQYNTDRRQHPFLNYVSLELAVGIPYHEDRWDAILRIFHRSGAWGLYSPNADEGSTVGIGFRAKF